MFKDQKTIEALQTQREVFEQIATTPPTADAETEAVPSRAKEILTRILSTAQVDAPSRPQQPPPGSPPYRMRQFLAEMDLYVQYPHLSRKDRRKMAGQSDPRNVPDASGKVRAAARGKPKEQP